VAKKTKKEIEDLINKIGLNNVELAERLSISPNTISRWKVQKAVPGITWEKMEKLALTPDNNEINLRNFSNDMLMRELRRRLKDPKLLKKKTAQQKVGA
jgi:transposase-like protein